MSVFLAYLGPRGRTLIDREVYLPGRRSTAVRRAGVAGADQVRHEDRPRPADADPRGDVSDFGASSPRQGASTPTARVAPGPPALITITAPRTAPPWVCASSYRAADWISMRRSGSSMRRPEPCTRQRECRCGTKRPMSGHRETPRFSSTPNHCCCFPRRS